MMVCRLVATGAWNASSGLGKRGAEHHVFRFTIRDNREYRADYATFEEYCKKRWNRGRWVINKLIEAAEVVNNLGENITQIQKLPCNAGQAAALAKSTDTPEQQVEVWKAVVESGKPITAAVITKIAQR
ncbi:hypothetical protein [Schlesneria sp. T3-172]|uniref:hypothetical protein n=1 Tax=Schlesneria sphaerica TaxID=3373610 RepID=UPI0037C6DD61